MLDFDFMCKRSKPSVACMVFPFSGNHYIKFYWGTVSKLIGSRAKRPPAVHRQTDVYAVSCMMAYLVQQMLSSKPSAPWLSSARLFSTVRLF